MTRATRKNSVVSLDTTCARDDVGGEGLSQVEELLEAGVFDLQLFEATNASAEAGVFVGEPLVVGLDVDQVDVAHRRSTRRRARGWTLRTGRGWRSG